MNKETVNEQRNSIILYTYIQDIQLIKGSIYHKAIELCKKIH